MKIEFRLITAVIVTAVLISAAVAVGARSRLLDEDGAIALLEHTLKRDRVYEKRISLDCISYSTEETTNAYFEFVLREIHNAKCGGDPEMSLAIDRIAFIAVPAKSRSGKQLKTNARVQGDANQLACVRKIAPAEASAIVIFYG